MRILITGASGALGSPLAAILLAQGHRVTGMDGRPWRPGSDPFEFLPIPLHRRAAEDVFRTRKPEAVIHLASGGRLPGAETGQRRILENTRRIVRWCARYGVDRWLFVGRHTVYGARPDAPLYRSEEAPPMGGTAYPELADLLAADLYACTAIGRLPELRTTVLRLVYPLGPSRTGSLARYLKHRWVPTVLGFDPLLQVIHEQDAARAIRISLEARLSGVFNVAGPDPLPLSWICRETRRVPVPIAEPLYPFLSGRLGLPRLHRGVLRHLKYPILLDDSSFRRATGFRARFDVTRTLEAFRDAD